MATSKKVSKNSARRTTQSNSRKSTKSRTLKGASAKSSLLDSPLGSSDQVEPWHERDPEDDSRWNVQSGNRRYSTRGRNEDYDYDEDDQEDENLFVARGQQEEREQSSLDESNPDAVQ